MIGLRLNECDIDVSNQFAGGEVEKRVARAIIAIPDEHATEYFGEEFVLIAVLHAEVVGRAAEHLDMSEVSGNTIEIGVWNTARIYGCSGRG
jgi:hypothetical protein